MIEMKGGVEDGRWVMGKVCRKMRYINVDGLVGVIEEVVVNEVFGVIL